MAGDWLKIEATTPDKPEVWQIAGALDIDPDAVVGKLLRVWLWFDQHSEDGNAPSVTKKLLDRNVGVTGFVDAMILVGWMQEGDGTISIPRFGRHNGKPAKKRAETARRVARHKQQQRDENATVTDEALPDTYLEGEGEKEGESKGGTPDGVPVDENADRRQCPIQKIIDLYHEVLPELPAVQKRTKARDDQIRARWREDLTSLEDWRAFFEFCRRSDFLMGRTQPSSGRSRAFVADLEWLTKAGNFAKIRELRYHDQSPQATEQRQGESSHSRFLRVVRSVGSGSGETYDGECRETG